MYLKTNLDIYCTSWRKKSSIILFLIGLFSITQIKMPGFALCISEFPIYIIAPFLFIKNYWLLKQHGMMYIIGLGICVSIMCVVSGLYNQTHPFFILKGLSSTYPLFAFPVVLHHLLWRNFKGLRWLLLGVACSSVLSTFVFQTSTEINMLASGATGSDAVEAIMSGPIFWIGRLQNFITLPIYGWYLTTPILYSTLAPLGFALFAMLTTISGRSTAMGAIGGAFIAILCGKSRTKIKRFTNNFFVILIISIIGIIGLNGVYRFMALGGYLGEKAQEKYLAQSKGSSSVLKLLMGGRAEFFVGAIASLDKPFIGHGPWAIDDGGYYDNFLSEYGDIADYEKHMERKNYQYRTIGVKYGYIPAHSHVISFWLWFGVVGLYYWVYIIYSIIRYLHKEIISVPQWIGFLAVGAPTTLWALFFSGFGYRIYTMPYIVALLIAHNVSKGKIPITDIDAGQLK